MNKIPKDLYAVQCQRPGFCDIYFVANSHPLRGQKITSSTAHTTRAVANIYHLHLEEGHFVVVETNGTREYYRWEECFNFVAAPRKKYED